MSSRKHLLVVADQTLESRELIDALARRAATQHMHVTLLVPTPVHKRASVGTRLARVVERLAQAGVDAVGVVGDSIATVAVVETWDPTVFDEVVVSTLPTPLSRWLRIGLPQRIAALTGSRVQHVVASSLAPHSAGVAGPARIRDIERRARRPTAAARGY
jgi:hypothetical protein